MQKHFANILQDIPRINDETYDGFNYVNGKIRQNNFHLEDNTTPGFGKGSEASIARFFYDLYDSAEYIFESFGETDTVIEIFQFIVGYQSYDYIISSDDDSGDDYNFKISLNLIINEKLLFRIRISGWESIGDYRLAITKSSHIHNYSYKYVKDDNFTHYAYCSCGEYKKEQHIFFTEKLGHRCVACKYYTEGPITGILKSMSIVMYNDKKKRDFFHNSISYK